MKHSLIVKQNSKEMGEITNSAISIWKRTGCWRYFDHDTGDYISGVCT